MTRTKKKGDVVKTKTVGRPTTSGSPSSWSVSIKDRSIVYRRLIRIRDLGLGRAVNGFGIWALRVKDPNNEWTSH